MALLDQVKLAARIKGNTLDAEITRLIAWAKAEMTRAGVPDDVAVYEGGNNESLLNECIIQGVLMHISTDERIREAAEKAFLYQLDNLRKSTWTDDPAPEPDDPDDGGDPSDP